MDDNKDFDKDRDFLEEDAFQERRKLNKEEVKRKFNTRSNLRILVLFLLVLVVFYLVSHFRLSIF